MLKATGFCRPWSTEDLGELMKSDGLAEVKSYLGFNYGIDIDGLAEAKVVRSAEGRTLLDLLSRLRTWLTSST